ncbi:iron-containing alcohol dehydrogenase [Oceanobacillus sp. M65]|uniref:iron-containing alcohol dehydrogenase n=1 Tax=Oceanobacillus sp. M65 TaxID=3457435 RepID=UPI003FCC7289
MAHFISPKNIYHGAGSLKHLNEIIKDLQVKSVFLLVDPMIKELGVIDSILVQLDKYHIKVEISTDVVPEPTLYIGDQIVDKVRKTEVELVIGVGGGSALDLAKVAAVLGKNEGKVEDYLNLKKKKRFTNKGLPKVLIPTTSGTGSEVTDIAVFSLENTKDVITHENLLADYAIVDPELTYTLPPKITAASGIDALTHAIEAYTSVHSTALTDTLALDAMGRIYKHIRNAVWNSHDKEAREQMALGSLIAGLSFYNAGVAGVHGLAYPLGGLFKIPHGESNAVLLPYVYGHIWSSCLAKMTNIAKAFNLPIDGKSDQEIAMDVVQRLQDLVREVGLPTSLKEYDIHLDDIMILAENGMKQTRLLNRSPKPLDIKDIQEIYTSAYKGQLVNDDGKE